MTTSFCAFTIRSGRHRTQTGPAFALVVLCIVLMPTWGFTRASGTPRAQDSTPVVADTLTATTDPVTIQSLQNRRKSIEENAAIEESVKTNALEILNNAIAALQQEQSFVERAQSLQASTENISGQLEATRAELEAPTEELEEPSRDDDLATVQQRLQTFEEQLRKAEAEKTDLDQQEAFRTKRRTEVPVELTQAKASLAALDAAAAEEPAEGQNPVIRAANAALRDARRRALVARIELLQRELPVYDATSSLLAAQRSLAARKVAVARRAVAAWQGHVNEQRASEAENNLAQARELLSSASDAAVPVAADVLKLAESLVDVRTNLSRDIAETTEAIQQVELRTKRLKTEFEEITARAEAAGLTNSVGVLLRKQNSSLPDQRRLAQEIADRQAMISSAHIERIDYQNRRSAVDDVEELAERTAVRYGTNLSDEDRRALQDELRIIFQANGRYLDGVISDLSSYLDRLATLDVRQRALLEQTVEQSDYMLEHVLWVRSATPIDSQIPGQLVDSVRQLRTDITATGQILTEDVVEYPHLWLLAILAGTSLLLWRKRFRESIRQAGEQAGKRITTQMQPTLRALGVTIIVSAIWPGVFWFIGWRLNASRASAFETAVGLALQSSAVLAFTLDVMRHVCRPNGLGVAHFEWPPRSVDTIRLSVKLLIFVAVPLTAVSLMMDRAAVDIYRISLGRLTLMAALITLAVAMHRVLRPGSPVIEEAATGTSNSWIRNARFFWYALGVGTPLVLTVLAAMGYLYTARQLSLRLIQSGWLLLSVVLVVALLTRWQLLTYRALAMKQARERRAALLQEGAQAAVSDDGEVTLPAFEESIEALSDSNLRLGKLLSVVFGATVITGMLIIWSDVLPALGVLSRFEVWDSAIPTEVVDGIERFEKITLRELSLAVVVLVLTVFSASNFPGLLEFAVLRRLPFDSGTRYATSTVVRYAITVIGIAMSFNLIGLGWANIQWLVAAMTVGLGFGLQEIFANFVSGLILLFERPIRIGDTVTVGSITGTVTRIRIRATTIVDWDRKELVVPNKEFVTGQLINWTLSDSVLRVIIHVGIAYGSDTQLATRLLYRVAEDNPNVLDEPAPKVVFFSFGESSLDFELRCFVGSLHLFRNIPHDLNLAVDNLFREHNIEIAFPQRDLHVRSFDNPVPVAAGRGDT